MNRRLSAALVALLLTVHALLVAWIVCRDSAVVDEPAHIVSGVYTWEFRRFDLYRVNPPLVRTVAAVPLVASGAKTDWAKYRYGPLARAEFSLGRDFVAANEDDWPKYLALARIACIPFSLLGAYVCYRWASELFGAAAGLIAIVLWCFSPTVLGFAAHVTSDLGAAAIGVLAGYLFWRWLREPTWRRATAAGIGLGLLELTKTTWIVLFALWPILWLVWNRFAPQRVQRAEWLRQGRQFCVIVVVGLYLLNLGYAFEGFAKPLREYRFGSRILAGEGAFADDGAGGNRLGDTWLGALPVPLPQSYVSGIDLQRVDLDAGAWSYMRGEWKRGGWWYFYLYAILVKTPSGTLLLLLLALTLSKRRQLPIEPPGAGAAIGWRDYLILLAPAAAVLALVSSQLGFNHHPRYVLPALPFLFIAIARVGSFISMRRPVVSGLTLACLVWSVGSSLAAFPHSLSYSNELAGGPKNGHEHLINSATDWGQDHDYLHRWLDEHPEAQGMKVDLFGASDSGHPSIVPGSPPPGPHLDPGRRADLLGPQPGWYAVSGTRLHDREGWYEYLRHFEPAARAGYSINIYHITLDEANRVRSLLGLPEFETETRHQARWLSSATAR